jgi:predicted glycogen debranching enzyme
VNVRVTDGSEWLEADGLGGFASGTATTVRTRRYHALLLPATTPPTGRLVLVNGFEAWAETPAGRFALSSNRYAPDVTHPDGFQRIEAFETDPWPRWTFVLGDGTRIEQSILMVHGSPLTVVSWRLLTRAPGVRLTVRPFLSGRDYHSLHHENGAFRFDAEQAANRVTWRPYDGIPAIASVTNGAYTHQPDWFRNVLYEEERSRGLDFTEDLASPGVFAWSLSDEDAVWMLTTEGAGAELVQGDDAAATARRLRAAEERRRKKLGSPLARAADVYFVRRGTGQTIVAGYPWFTDWGRDTFIALRGLGLANDRLEAARNILLEWAGTISEGMLPNRFPDGSGEPEYNSVDASLWYIIAIFDYLEAADASGHRVTSQDRKVLHGAIDRILAGYAQGTRFGIRMDDDGLLAAGVPGVQLTWMDAKVGDWVVTPRVGKPVEVQALWLNALCIASRFSDRWRKPLWQGLDAFQKRFWNAESGSLYDVVDPDHRRGAADATFRPNQIFAVGGLPLALFDSSRARQIVDAVEARLWTPLGLRSLARGEAGYAPRYEGGVLSRDGSYHQGTVWPWLLGAFVEAWVRVHGNDGAARRRARERFLDPLMAHLAEAGLGHVSEIADADAPHRPRGCPFQAWSLGELIRLDRVILRPSARPPAVPPAAAGTDRPSASTTSAGVGQ